MRRALGSRGRPVLLVALMALIIAAMMPVHPASAAAPKAPKNVRAAGISDDAIQVRWKAVRNAERYQVFHEASGGSSGFQSLGKTKQLSFTHAGLEPNSSHAYVVRAIGAKRSKPSAQASATTADSDAAPNTPTGLAPTVAFDRVDLEWLSVADATGYEVLRSAGGGTAVPLPGTVDPELRDEDVAVTQAHSYVVRAVGAGGMSGTSFPANVVVPDCHQTLDRLGVEWQVGADQPEVPEPVVVTLPLNGVEYYATSNTSVPQASLYMDCAFAVALHRMADASAPFDLAAVTHFGIYNYRCITGTGTPPDCTLSNSAYGRAIDIAALRDGSGLTYSVEDDWVGSVAIDDTCDQPTTEPKDEYLHLIVCAWFDEGAFDIILTPNYSAPYADHFGADVQDGAHFME